jgi:glycosyltransferase involved in cell wall biosynthesis
VRASLGVADDIPIVLGVGTGDLRKGIDLFIEVARIVNEDRQYRCAFIWIGAVDAVVRNRLSSEGRWPDPTPPWLHLVGFQEDTAPYHSAADVLALTSREDPFPNVVLESMDAGVPVLAFARTGGGAHLAATLAGAVSPPFDLNEYVTHLVGLLLDGERRARIGAACQARVDAEHDFRHYTARILALLDGDVVNAHVPMGVVNP